uniref:Uncharacterized protein n=1 Tax=Knipowitschia caucasica TaxID=637954 RepID=A0AAV2JML7_KNICA
MFLVVVVVGVPHPPLIGNSSEGCSPYALRDRAGRIKFSPSLLLLLSREEVTCCRPAPCHLADFLSSLPQERATLQAIGPKNYPPPTSPPLRLQHT